MTPAEIIHESRRLGLTLRVVNGGVGVRPKARLTGELAEAIREHKPELVAALLDRDEAYEERAAILQYEYGHDRADAEDAARWRIQFVTCGSCVYWTGHNKCDAGLNISEDPSPDVAIRLCGFHRPKGGRV